MQPETYRIAAAKYKPARIRVLFVAESPPYVQVDKRASYFFFEDNPGADILFATLIEALYRKKYRKGPGCKPRLLGQLKNDGYWLIDAVEFPINRASDGLKCSDREREKIIGEYTTVLLTRLDRLRHEGPIDTCTKIILIKETVFNTLFSLLRSHGYTVINNRYIGFPRYYGDRAVIHAIRRLLFNCGTP